MQLRSRAFEDAARIPKKYTEDGQNISPPLEIVDVPPKTETFALICDDPDAPSDEPFVHWVLYDLPASVRELPEGLPRSADLDRFAGAHQGHNSFSSNNLGYRGPAPPHGHGLHHYRFHLYALPRALNLSGGLGRRAVEQAIRNQAIAEATLVGTYER